jgi:hypothetical protein
LRLEWYWKRLRRMSAAEMVTRTGDVVRRRAWRHRQVHQEGIGEAAAATAAGPAPSCVFGARLPSGVVAVLPEDSRRGVVEAAERLLQSGWTILGVDREDLADPDWFLDPVTGRRAPQDRYSFSINHRSEEEVGNVKQVWELSRHHHLTVLAAAWFISGDDRYAEVVARQLHSWWRENPFLSGVHWTSGIEIGIRLISWVWIRRLLDGWEGIGDLFERNAFAIRQVGWHQQYLAAFRSTGSSANNHVIAEAAGQLMASCAFPWFPESGGWRADAAGLLERELNSNSFPSGLNRELASEYHCLVTELALLAAAEADTAGHSLCDATWARLSRSVDAAAAIVDVRLAGPRQGDGDDGRALLLDPPGSNRWLSLLALGAGLIGEQPWWPAVPPDVRSTVVAAMAGGPRKVGGRPSSRAWCFADAGLTILRSSPRDGPEIWCRGDAGPHGFLSIAAHAHADALSVEVRHGGIEVLIDPGTYCYHGEPDWRAYFRSTIAHNTLELAGEDQSLPGGPFLWSTQATTRLLSAEMDVDRGNGSWTAEHDGYRRLDPPAVHRRTVSIDSSCRQLAIVDQVLTHGRHRCRLVFHLGPEVEAVLEGAVARLEWPAAGGTGIAAVSLPTGLTWSIHRGETKPIVGWYSEGFGCRQPTIALIGTGLLAPTTDGAHELLTVVEFAHGGSGQG